MAIELNVTAPALNRTGIGFASRDTYGQAINSDPSLQHALPMWATRGVCDLLVFNTNASSRTVRVYNWTSIIGKRPGDTFDRTYTCPGGNTLTIIRGLRMDLLGDEPKVDVSGSAGDMYLFAWVAP